jgi:hypothetical protein
MFATSRGGVLPVATAILLPLGVWTVLQRRDPVRDVLLFGLLFAPFPVSLALPQDPKFFTPRDLLVIPFAVLLCGVGLERLWSRGGWIGRAFGVALLAAVPYQFMGFADYYTSGYRAASASRFDTMNLEAVADYVIARDQVSRVPVVYLSRRDVGTPHAYQWGFYLLERHRDDLMARSRHFIAPNSPNDIPTGSLVVLDASDRNVHEIESTLGCSLVHVVSSVGGGEPAAFVLQRN